MRKKPINEHRASKRVHLSVCSIETAQSNMAEIYLKEIEGDAKFQEAYELGKQVW